MTCSRAFIYHIYVFANTAPPPFHIMGLNLILRSLYSYFHAPVLICRSTCLFKGTFSLENSVRGLTNRICICRDSRSTFIRDDVGSENLGGQGVMQRTIAARQCLLICQNLKLRCPPLPPFLIYCKSEGQE